MPGMRMNDRQMKQAMKKMGVKQTPMEGVTEVVIRTKTSETVLKNPSVVCIEMPGTKAYEISGPETVRTFGDGEAPEPEATFEDADIELVMAQTGCGRDKAVEALKASGGEPAEAIVKIISE